MALILDKTATGITSMIVVSGITNDFVESGYTETELTQTGWIETTYFQDTYTRTTYSTGYTSLIYTDPFGGVNPSPYLIINMVSVDRINKLAKIGVSIYTNKTSRENNNRPIETCFKEISYPVLFDTYFSMGVLESSNVFAEAYKYISTIYTGWKSDE